jgi:hypothetical protein
MRFSIGLLALLAASPALAEGIVPKDGAWTTTTETISFADSCSAEITPILEPMTNAFRSEETQEIFFGGTFDPRKIDSDNQAGVNWTQIDANTWQGAMAHPATGLGSVASIRVVAVTEERIEGQMQMDIGQLFAADPEMSPLAAIADGCAITIDMVTIFAE